MKNIFKESNHNYGTGNYDCDCRLKASPIMING